MINTFQPYSDSKNLIAIRVLAWNIIRDVAPDEELSSKKLTDRIVQAWEEGKFIVAEINSTTAGGFGNIDLVLLVVIPVVIAVLNELGKQLVVWGVDALKKRIGEKEANKRAALEIIEVTVEREYKSVNRKVKSKKARSKEKITKQAIKIHIKKLLGLEP